MNNNLKKTKMNNNFKNNLNNYIPIIVYNNFELDKQLIISQNTNKIGIYCILNIKNGKKYVGMFEINLGVRLNSYYYKSNLIKKSGLILPAILNYGHSSFCIEILEYCEKSIIRERELYYINSIQSEYNIKGKKW